jgi:hypothetical protein
MTDMLTRIMQEQYQQLKRERRKDPAYNILACAEGNRDARRPYEGEDTEADYAIAELQLRIIKGRMSPETRAKLVELNKADIPIYEKVERLKRIY